ncbi:DUF4335 domain-containing protein [Spirulina major CS-329]|uniref:DUF4335 domain-containing protein n=1 Tax=Spirulina TaxID=1154 RepID=UPI00233069AC|nr:MULTISPECIES: DUF4335 domain-containing protein [Spirulina]MDB9495801.1 DUF4335 domain-containing protein [Spirulina subsalsa CS-330]MDB9503761.1 DUF4335 domain-containing protein [Spirulina major CS-329]
MSIKRQYNLPNVRLQLDGMNPSLITTDSAATGQRPLMSIVTNVECHFSNSEQFLSGGREFLDSLVRAVSQYGQEVLSGIPHPLAHEPAIVRLMKGDKPDRHLLVSETPDGQTVNIHLNTLELFDLVDVVDQFCSDTRTLPDLQLTLEPISRRHRLADVPAHERAMPLMSGVGSLAIAAVLLFFLPVPEVTIPEDRPAEATEQTDGEDLATDDPPLTPEDEADEEAANEEADELAATEAEDPPAQPTGDRISSRELEALLTDAEPIEDPTELDFIQRYLFREISGNWDDRDAVTEDLAFRVSATIDGSIVAYEAVDDTPASADELTPLPDLEFAPTQAAIEAREAIADYKVVFTRNGVLQINPWAGYQGRPGYGETIDDPDTLAQIQDDLIDTLRDVWDEDGETLGNDLIFRVGVTESGAIADYQPQNNAAFQLEGNTPLPDLLTPEAAGIDRERGSVIPSEPMGQFQVIFKEGGRVEVSPF